MIRRARGNPLARVAPVGHQDSSARGQARFPLANPSPEACVALQGFNVPVAQADRVLEFVQGHVFAATDQDFHDFYRLGAISPQMLAKGPWAVRS